MNGSYCRLAQEPESWTSAPENLQNLWAGLKKWSDQMGIHVVWYDAEKTIIVWEFDGTWEWQDYHAAINTAVVMIKSVNHVVDSIMDLRRNRSLPPNALMEGKRWFVVAPSNFGVTVVAGGSGLIRGIATTIAAVYKRFSERILMAGTVDEAIQIIHEKKRQRQRTSPH